MDYIYKAVSLRIKTFFYITSKDIKVFLMKLYLILEMKMIKEICLWNNFRNKFLKKSFWTNSTGVERFVSSNHHRKDSCAVLFICVLIWKSLFLVYMYLIFKLLKASHMVKKWEEGGSNFFKLLFLSTW